MVWRCCVFLLFALQLNGQVRWTGLAGTSRWSDAANWEHSRLPGPADDVVLDHFFRPGSYRVLLPDSPVSVKSLQIRAGLPDSIVLELPASSLVTGAAGSSDPRAFETTGPGYSLDIAAGGIFLNASGAASGYSVRFRDSIRIQNGGRYIHRTRTGHAELVLRLSSLPGTESGIFRFENTDASSTVSLSGRTYGTIQLSAAGTAAGITSYSSSGTNVTRVRGNLELEPGVSFSLHFDDTLRVSGGLQMQDATLNLSSGNRSSVLLLGGNLVQRGGLITETNQSGQVGRIVFAGTQTQWIHSTGIIRDSVALEILNTAGVHLSHNLRIPYRLYLQQGPLVTGPEFLLQLGPGAGLQADPLSNDSYIEGKLVMEALEGGRVLCPIGHNGKHRWLAMEGARGDFSIEYIPESALNIGTLVGEGLDHVSQLEYWKVKSLSGQAGPGDSVKMELSFDPETSGWITQAADLRVAAFDGVYWTSAGNTGTNGWNGGMGSVTGMALKGVGQGVLYFSLASANYQTNILPVYFERLHLETRMEGLFLNWRVSGVAEADSFFIEISTDGTRFTRAGAVAAMNYRDTYEFRLPNTVRFGFCRVLCRERSGRGITSETLRFHQQVPAGWLVRNPAVGNQLQVQSPVEGRFLIELFTLSGMRISQTYHQLFEGINHIGMPSGTRLQGLLVVRISRGAELLTVQRVVFGP